MFERILIAARGEVGARLARTCLRIGVETVGVHIESEADSVHAHAFDESIPIGADPSAYGDRTALIRIAKENGCVAVHPGYGAALDPAFAAAVEEAGLAFIGPSSERLQASYDRLHVRSVAREAGVRILDGSDRPILEASDALEDVDRIGYPVVAKSVLGLGDPHPVPKADDVADLNDAISTLWPLEARGGAYFERYIERPRHVSVDCLFDGEEAFVLGDCEVSVRRSGRRLLGESPAPALNQLHDSVAVRGAIWQAAQDLVFALGCKGLSSFHFLIGPDSRFYFVDHQPGLAVEHAMTEMCTGLDLVEMQVRIAAGEGMPPEVTKNEATGSALQARIDAAADPETGKAFASRVEHARWPPAPQGKVRIESAVKIGSQVHPELGPLVATVTTYAPNRHDALLMLDRILAEIHLRPLVTNLRLLRKLLNHESLRAGQYDEGFLDRI